eukprot:CAMPEP_0180233886 /NCGR_PEP_ID=MMETSP0987-20121128/28330_1 /TAXON_ID=697907 /ORGANISM="non described non described, Strain CCMP2293" /LENGTH=349 /DNA_ID=CAMNT_0022199765 /DNA_START=143 /DNA_END=1189 /DNA_ORIENTATION=+
MDDAIGVNTHIITFDPPTGPWTDEPLPFEVGRNYPIIPGVLAFAVHPSREYTALQIERNPDLFFNSSMEPESYRNYCSDFGPVDLGLVVQFCRQLRTLLHDPRLRGRPVIYYSQLDEAFCTNTAFLLGAYLVLVERWSPEAAAAPLERIEPSPFKMFRDATDLPSDFDLSIRDCLRGLAKAAGAGFFDLESFDCDCFSAQDECGMSVVCPKFIAFKGPASGPNRPSYASEPEIYIEPFRHAGVSDVVRLNEASTYAPRVFEDATFRHHDMQFPDCTTPPLPIIERFLKTADEARGVVAVHCLAGLGRTCTLIGIWIMGKYGWGARETIAWLRIVRPGSVIGPQQHFLLA